MNDSILLDAFRRKVCQEVDIEPEGVGRYLVYTPFMFDDGDHFVVILRRAGASWAITDEGHTLMHLSYSGVDLSRGNRATIVEESLAEHGVENRAGELTLPVPGEAFGDALFSFLQALSSIATVTKFSHERVASSFADDFVELLGAIVPSGRTEFDWNDPERDPDANYAVDCRINGSQKPCFVFAINSTNKCSHATITCLMFERWGVAFRSVALFEDQTKIDRKPLAQLTNVVGKQFSSIAERERIKGYFDEDVLRAT